MNIKHKIPQQDLINLQIIFEKYKNNNYEVYLVGGAVRDALMNKPIKDFDLATNAPLDITKQIFQSVIPTGEEFGTLTVLLGNNEYEITRFRKDLDTDGRRATVVGWADTLKEDISRRDLTINGLACNLEDYEVIDYVGGLKDLENKKLNFIGSVKDRVEEDHLRSIRYLRFLHRYPNFSSSQEVFNSLSLYTNLDVISMERIFQEFEKILSYQDTNIKDEVIYGLLNINLFNKLELNINTSNYSILKKVFEQKNILPILIQKYFQEEKNPSFIWEKYKLSKQKYKSIFSAIEEYLKYKDKKYLMKSMLQHTKDINNIKSIYLVFNNSFYEEEFYKNLNEPICREELDINGNDLLEMGFKGSDIKKNLLFLLKKVWLNPEYNNKKNLINLIQKNSIKHINDNQFKNI